MFDSKSFTRGGQIALHNIRMFQQIMNKVLLATFLMLLVISGLSFLFFTTSYEKYIINQYIIANINWLFDSNNYAKFIQPDGTITLVSYQEILNSPPILSILKIVFRKLLMSLLVGLTLAAITFISFTSWLKRHGEKKTEDILVKGDKCLHKEITSKMIRKQGYASKLTLASLPLIQNTETSHFLFHGTTGTGKSTAIKELLEQIRARGDRAIIYDKSCNFLEEFYQPDSDVLLNPLDVRGQPWDLWAECRDSADFDSLAAAQIPMPLSSQDPFWVNAARTIFSAAAYEMRNDKKRSVAKLLKTLLTADLESIQHYLKGTEAETLVSDKIEKTAVSIKSVLATYLKSLKYIKEADNSFSIRNWIQDNQAKNWLFITSLGDRHETLKPLITAWLDIAVNSLLSLTPNEHRRIWLIIDELASLHQLPYLTMTLSESRKFGGCVVVGIQNYAQLAKIYGHEGAREISSLLNTRFMFRQPDPEMAKWSASNFGETYVDEMREGTSYGANTIRDGVSINRVETRKQVISYSEIMSLANLYAYVRLPGNFPITLVDFIYKQRNKYNAGFIKRTDFDELGLKKIDELITKATKQITKSSSNKIEKKNKEKMQPVYEILSASQEFDFDI